MCIQVPQLRNLIFFFRAYATLCLFKHFVLPIFYAYGIKNNEHIILRLFRFFGSLSHASKFAKVIPTQEESCQLDHSLLKNDAQKMQMKFN
jgi:hypothetical protein